MRILLQSNLSALCFSVHVFIEEISCLSMFCLLYTSDAADE